MLQREGIELDVLANRVDAQPGRLASSTIATRPRARAAASRASAPVSPASPYAYVGDGYSDRCAALAADRIFARDSLARHLDGLGVVYEPFDDLGDVATLLRGTPRHTLITGR